MSRVPEGVFRELMSDRLSELSGMDSHRIQQFVGKPAQKTARGGARKPPLQGRERRPVREAITLLLHNPELSRIVTSHGSLARLDLPGIPLLLELLELLHEQPHLSSSGAVMEHFRGRDEAKYLWRLAQVCPDVPENGMAEEFQGIVRLLLTQSQEERWEYLQSKLEQNGTLTGEELDEWKSMVSGQQKR